MAPRAAFVSWGLMCREEGLGETAWPVWPAVTMFEVTVGTRAFIFTERDENSSHDSDWHSVWPV